MFDCFARERVKILEETLQDLQVELEVQRKSKTDLEDHKNHLLQKLRSLRKVHSRPVSLMWASALGKLLPNTISCFRDCDSLSETTAEIPQLFVSNFDQANAFNTLSSPVTRKYS